MQKRIIVIAPKQLGGITKVVENLLKGGLGKNSNLVFHPSTFEGGGLKKICMFIMQFVKGIILYVSFKPNLIHIHVSSHGSFYRKAFYIILSEIFRKKIIIHIHPTHFVDFIDSSGSLRRFFILTLLNRANLIITLTKQVQFALKNIYGLKCDIKVVSVPICLNDYEFHGAENREKSTVLYLGWIIRNKGVYDLLLAAPSIKERIRDFRLIYCGNKETNKLRKMVLNSGLSAYIEVNDWLNSEGKKSLLEKVTALILPTYTEGIPNVILEAMASGVPIITTPVGGIPSILTDKINCLYFNPGDIADMIEKITCLLGNEEMQEEIVQNNRKLVKQYDAKIISRTLEEIYDKL